MCTKCGHVILGEYEIRPTGKWMVLDDGNGGQRLCEVATGWSPN